MNPEDTGLITSNFPPRETLRGHKRCEEEVPPRFHQHRVAHASPDGDSAPAQDETCGAGTGVLSAGSGLEPGCLAGHHPAGEPSRAPSLPSLVSSVKRDPQNSTPRN